MSASPPPTSAEEIRVTVIIPTLNEAEGIGEVIGAIPAMEGREVLVVDTSSRDGTQVIARRLGAVVVDEPRRGYGRAYKTGFEKARGTVVVTLDGDGTYPAEEIPRLVAFLHSEGLDFITCDRLGRITPEAMSGKHRFGNWVLTTALRVLHRVRIRDSQSGMWIIRRSILPELELTDDGMPLSEELKLEAYKKGFRCAELPIEYRIRKGKVKLASWSDGWKNLKFLFRKRVRPRGAGPRS